MGVATTMEMEVASTTEMEVASKTEMEVASTMRAPPSVDYDAAARLALIVEAEVGVAWANRERRVREAEEAEELLPARESEVEEMIRVNEVSNITVIAPAASAFVVVHTDLVSTHVFFRSSPPSACRCCRNRRHSQTHGAYPSVGARG
jgi:hypothetical protein